MAQRGFPASRLSPYEEGVSRLFREMVGIPQDARKVFLWELVREAIEALYQKRLKSLYDSELGDPQGLSIGILPDKHRKTLTIFDNGIGMTGDNLKELFSCAGTSLEKFKDIIDKLRREEINIDEFYVRDWDVNLGFFATFMVADMVEISTRPYGSFEVWSLVAQQWGYMHKELVPISGTQNEFRLTGTRVTLHLKPDQFEYLEEGRLKVLIDKFTFDLCPYPITICSDGKYNIEPIKRLADVEEEKKDMELMREKFKGLQNLFQKVLCELVKEVIVSDRIFDLPSCLSLDGERLEINPRSSLMEKLRHDAEYNPEDENVVGMIKLQYQTGKYCIYLHEQSSMPWREDSEQGPILE